MNLEDIMLNEIGRTQKDKHRLILLTSQTHRDRVEWWLGRGEWGVVYQVWSFSSGR